MAYGHSHHDYPATDIFARRGCAFVSLEDGSISEVSATDRWDPRTDRGADRGGLSVSLLGKWDDVRYYGSHLGWIAPGIRPGVPVKAGQLLGRIGNSGDARSVASHLHFGISWETPKGVWWVRRGWIWPWSYLDAWRAGVDRSPKAEMVRAPQEAGTVVPPCMVDC